MFDIRYNQDRISLDKSSKKYICPSCGKRTFVNYVYPSGESVASGECGRCDRLDNCAYHCPPKQYFAEHKTLTDYRQPIRPRQYHKTYEPPQPPSYIDKNIMLASLKNYSSNPLAVKLHNIFDRFTGAEIVDSTLIEYATGTSKKFGGSACYWEIDHLGGIRNAHIMGYYANGKRNGKNSHVPEALHLQNFNKKRCFFGAHVIVEKDRRASLKNEERRQMNISGEVNPEIWLFESQKAALIVEIFLKWGGASDIFVPMACCGCQGLNPTSEAFRDPYDKHQVLKGRKVVLFPDNGKFSEWMARGKKLRRFASEVWMTTCMERDLHPHKIDCEINAGDGFDDILLRYLDSGKDVWNLINTCYGFKGKNRIA